MSSLGDIFSLRLSFLPAARSNNSPQTISERALFFLTTGKVSVNTQGGTGGLRQGDITRMNFLPCQCPSTVVYIDGDINPIRTTHRRVSIF